MSTREGIACALAFWALLGLVAWSLKDKRPFMLWILPLLALDALANWIFARASPRNTLSGEAWQQREQPYFFWTHRVIDWFFGAGHCQAQAMREALWGSAWRAWLAEFRNDPLPPKGGPT